VNYIKIKISSKIVHANSWYRPSSRQGHSPELRENHESFCQQPTCFNYQSFY